MKKPRLYPSSREIRLMQVIKFYHDVYGHPPSFREMKILTFISTQSFIGAMLRRLENFGYLEKEFRRSRTVHLTQAGIDYLDCCEPVSIYPVMEAKVLPIKHETRPQSGPVFLCVQA